jgi:hypothetical protein
MNHVRCGIWRVGRRLVASTVDTEGRCSRASLVPQGESDRWDWLSSLWAEHGLDVELVMVSSLARTDPIGRTAMAHRMTVWLVPDRLLEGLREAARPRSNGVARMLARLPECNAWRCHLTRLISIDDPRQLPLF